jgi:hypothetical protein
MSVSTAGTPGLGSPAVEGLSLSAPASLAGTSGLHARAAGPARPAGFLGGFAGLAWGMVVAALAGALGLAYGLYRFALATDAASPNPVH